MVRSSVRGDGTRPGVQHAAERGGHGGSHAGAEPEGSGDGNSRHGRPRRRRKHRILRWSATAVAIVVLGTAGAGYLYYQHLNGNIRKGQRSSGASKAEKAAPNAAGQTPLNILLIGSDSRNSAENLKLGGSKQSVGSKPLGDVQMLIHLSADRKSAAVVSIPRDTRVDIPKCTDPETGDIYQATNDIINTSLQRGGAGCTLATWQNLTKGVYIDHWMTIDFAGVVRMADAVGGVEVCVQQNVHDRPLPRVPGGSGLKLTAGKKKVTGKQALQWLRTRHAWGSDIQRAKAQHMYMNSMIRTLREQNVFTDSGRLMKLAEAATKSLKVSEEIGSVKKLYDLGMQLKTVPTNRITMLTMPTAEDPLDANHLIPAAGADKIWAMIRDDVPFDKNGDASKKKATASAVRTSEDLAAADGEIGVVVQNATGAEGQGAVNGRANAVTAVLTGKGFARATADRTTATGQAKTVVRYPSAELAGDALAVAKALGIPTSSVEKTTAVSGVTVIVGADWRSGSTYPKQTTPKAGDVPAGSDALNGAKTDACMPVYAPYRF
ncbi:LCP family protein [Streptomyces cavernae]|uniref:LCP family protein n=1 Tax=Streptomyces cavernae TaxID=2259034 RepID=UPI000FEBD87A|nr:LCP family protein [Streptomyces cavernae]